MNLVPVQKLIDEFRKRVGTNLAVLLGLLLQAMVLVERSLFVSTQIVLLAVELNVPDSATSAEKWLGKMCNSEPPLVKNM